ncbi:MAG TPA: class I SAM-dependent methyltransferase [Anaerolineae bacterium]|nr:class I SAM-dependent methyltransferase [Anaerolineae bacterium]
MSGTGIATAQEQYYDALWSKTRVVEPSAWALWKTISGYVAGKSRILEIGAGNRPRVPISGSYFVDLSASAMQALRGRNGHCAAASGEALPFADEAFDLICALEIVEHVPDDTALLQEIGRVLKAGERFLFSVPLHMAFWTRHDVLAGHVRRYDPAALELLLPQYGLPIEKYCITSSPRNVWYRNATALLAARFWSLGVMLESRMALPAYCWLDRRRGMKWRQGSFAEQSRGANNVIIVTRKQ